MAEPQFLQRVATVVVAERSGTVLGALPPFVAETPWWMDVGPLVRAIRERNNLRITILRLLDAELPEAHGGAVTYLAEVHDADCDAARQVAVPWDGALVDDALRLSYARIGGPEADLKWATNAIVDAGLRLAGEPRQIRTWNLSSLWRLDVHEPNATTSALWLKVVPPFFAHEGIVLQILADESVPSVLAHDGTRTLTREVRGDDLHDASLSQRLAMIHQLVTLQHRWSSEVDTLAPIGLPDWRANALLEALPQLIHRRRHDLALEDSRVLHSFLATLVDRLDDIRNCGLNDTLVHGDFHSGNVRGYDNTFTIMDWADSGLGHPLLDMSAFFRRTSPDDQKTMCTYWYEAWSSRVPGSHPEKAAALAAPIAAARSALVYQRFLDQIEETEHVYHRNDVTTWLGVTATLLRAEAD